MNAFELPELDLPDFVGFTPLVATAEPWLEELDADWSSPVYGILTALSYREGNGEISRCRINMLGLFVWNGEVALTAYCIERCEKRRFLVAEITCFRTPDGEEVEPKAFWLSMGLDPYIEAAQEREDAPVGLVVGAYINILCGIADSGGEHYNSESDAVMMQVELALAHQKIDLVETQRWWLYRRILHTFPSGAVLEESFETVFGRDSWLRVPSWFQKEMVLGIRAISPSTGDKVLQISQLVENLESGLE